MHTKCMITEFTEHTSIAALSNHQQLIAANQAILFPL